MSEPDWTPQQRQSIETTDRSLLVSAAAGSGKTAVLAERCAYLVCDAPEPCDIDELLVVTYTNAAAAEMRTRIEAALRRRLARRPDARVSRQLLLIGRAQISTLHSFCNKLLRQHFHAAGLDPNFRLLSEDESRLIRRDVGNELLESRHERDGDGTFQSLIELQAGGDDKQILRSLLQAHDLLGSLIDREGWLNHSVTQIGEAAEAKRLADSDLGRRTLALMSASINELLRCAATIQGESSRPGVEKYAAHVRELVGILEVWRSATVAGDFDALAAATCELKLPTLPVVKDQPDLKAAINALKKRMKEGTLASLCGFSEADWRDGLRRVLPATGLFGELVREFDRRFSKAKREQRSLDFTDLERLTLAALREEQAGAALTPSNIARSYQRQFRYVLVDEYQDVNEVQDAILFLLSRESSLGAPGVRPNLFSVGDVKQSIYRFRLAEPQRFLDRYEKLRNIAPSPCTRGEGGGESLNSFQPSDDSKTGMASPRVQGEAEFGQVIDLAQNFRSRSGLLETLNGIFERLMTRESSGIDYADSHRLIAGAAFPAAAPGTSHVELHLLPREPTDPNDPQADVDLEAVEREAAFVAHQIRSLLDAKHSVTEKDGTARPMRLSDCVVLLRSMKFKSEAFAAMLRGAGLATHSDSSTGFFDSMEIRDMLALLRVLENQQQDVPLAALLRSPISGLTDVDNLLATIRLSFPNADETPFYKAVVSFAPKHPPLKDFLDRLGDWRTRAHMQPLADVIWHVYDCTGYLAFVSGLPDGPQRVANLLDLHARAREFGGFHRQGLTRFMTYLTELEDQTDLGQPSPIGSGEEAVRIMSIHRAKGLEFPIVFVPDLGKEHNLIDIRGNILIDRQAGIGMTVPDAHLRIRYSSLAHVLAKNEIRRASITEELRVLYVALTRAREQLYLIGTIDSADVEAKVESGRAFATAFPAEAVLSGETMLDWLLPVAGSMSAARFEPPLAVLGHEADEVQQWCAAATGKREKSAIERRIASLEPIDNVLRTPETQRVINRLTWRYPHVELSKTAAVQSVGSLAKSVDAAPAAPSLGYVAQPTRELEPPRFMLTPRRVAAVDVGTATHRVIELLDFKTAGDALSIRRQIDDFIKRQLITNEEAGNVDVDAIAWFITTPIGREVCRAESLRREISIHYPLAALAALDPLDRVMVRGRIDLMFRTASGLVLIDFKTDRINADDVPARIERYRSQVNNYRNALVEITGLAVERSALVFLTPQRIELVG